MSYAVQGYLRWKGHSEDFWQYIIPRTRKWQPTPVFLAGEPRGQYEKLKRCDTRRWAPQVGRYPVCYWRKKRRQLLIASVRGNIKEQLAHAIINWSAVKLQHCVSSRCTTQWSGISSYHVSPYTVIVILLTVPTSTFLPHDNTFIV